MSDKINAKEELLHLVKHYKLKVIGAKVAINISDWRDSGREEFSGEFILPLLYTDKDWDDFLKFMDRKYDSGYGGQELFGTVVCEDGVWLDRGEYDGSEWWEVHMYPNLKELFGDRLALKYDRKKKMEQLMNE